MIHLISRFYERLSVVVTTNLSFDEWNLAFEVGKMNTALLGLLMPSFCFSISDKMKLIYSSFFVDHNHRTWFLNLGSHMLGKRAIYWNYVS